MRIKKAGGVVFGADLTSNEKKALRIEIEKELADWDRKNANEIDAIFLWVLYNQFDFTVEQLKEVHNSFRPAIEALCQRYEMTDKGDDAWLCTHKLKEIGVDIAEWNKEYHYEAQKTN